MGVAIAKVQRGTSFLRSSRHSWCTEHCGARTLLTNGACVAASAPNNTRQWKTVLGVLQFILAARRCGGRHRDLRMAAYHIGHYSNNTVQNNIGKFSLLVEYPVKRGFIRVMQARGHVDFYFYFSFCSTASHQQMAATRLPFIIPPW